MKKREIPALLRPKIMDLDYSVLAEMIRQQGRGRDTILAHITPKEAEMLKRMGGRGTINPRTGIPEFQPETYDYGTPYSYETPEEIASLYQSSAEFQPQYDTTPDFSSVISQYGPQFGEVTPETFTPPAGTYQDVQYGGAEQLGAVPGFRPEIPAQRKPFSFDIPEGMTAEQAYAAGAPEQDFLGSAGEAIKKYFGDEKAGPERIARALGVGATGVMGAVQARRAAKDAENLRREIASRGAPYEALAKQRLSGELTATQRQALAAQQAKVRQDLARRGASAGTAAQQAEANLQRQAQLYRDDNISKGAQLLGIADRYTIDAIKAAYGADQQARNLTASFFSKAMSMLPGMPQPVQVISGYTPRA